MGASYPCVSVCIGGQKPHFAPCPQGAWAFAPWVYTCYAHSVRITYDPAKNARNLAERGLSFDLARGMDWANALHVHDARWDYGEHRICAVGAIGAEMYSQIGNYV